ncbi:MAG: hypothetical protein AABW51_03855 [Nanoarchaeota archaeon]
MVNYRNVSNTDLAEEYKSILDSIGVLSEAEPVVEYNAKTIRDFHSSISDYFAKKGTLALLDIPIEPITKLALELLIIQGHRVAKKELREKQMKSLKSLTDAVQYRKVSG